jgi:hypothetical protein
VFLTSAGGDLLFLSGFGAPAKAGLMAAGHNMLARSFAQDAITRGYVTAEIAAANFHLAHRLATATTLGAVHVSSSASTGAQAAAVGFSPIGWDFVPIVGTGRAMLMVLDLCE